MYKVFSVIDKSFFDSEKIIILWNSYNESLIFCLFTMIVFYRNNIKVIN